MRLRRTMYERRIIMLSLRIIAFPAHLYSVTGSSGDLDRGILQDIPESDVAFLSVELLVLFLQPKAQSQGRRSASDKGNGQYNAALSV